MKNSTTNTKRNTRNYNFNPATMTLTMTAEFAENIYDPESDEYKILIRLQTDFPNLKIERKTHRTPINYHTEQGEKCKHNPLKGLTFNRMESFISLIPNSEKYEKEYYYVKKFAKSIDPAGTGYALTCKWFVKQFPNFRKNPMFYLSNSPELLSGIIFFEKARAASQEQEESEKAM